MRWPQNFQKRLAAWHRLRHTAGQLPPTDALHQINQWWFDAPWAQYHLHWDDYLHWPDPWQLLQDNVFCEVARALGIMYTICMMPHNHWHNVEMQETAQGIMIWVPIGKYILNWEPDRIVNINPKPGPVRRILTQQQILQKVK